MKDLQNSKMKFLKSFKYAFNGIFYAISSEVNMKFHMIAASAVVIGGFYFEVNSTEWMLLVAMIGLVLMAELINTSIERMSDNISKAQDEDIRRIKDMAAGAVLIISLSAAVIGLIVFIPKINIIF